MRKIFLMLGAAAPLLLARPANAQPDDDRLRAAAAAEEAAQAAESAARAARAAADALRRQMGQPPAAAPNGAPPPDENDQSLVTSVDTSVDDESRQREEARRISTSVANGPNYRTGKVTQEPDFQLVATDDKKVASVAWTLDLSGPSKGNTLVSTFFNVTASAALDKSGQTLLGDLTGLSDGTEVKLSLVRYLSTFAPAMLDEGALGRARIACLKKHKGLADAEKACNPSKFPTGVSDFVKTYAPEELHSFVNAVLPGGVWYYGLEGKASQASYHYIDRAAFAEKDISRFAYGATVFGGYIFGGGRSSLGLSLAVGRRYKAHDEVTLCQAINAVPQTQCITAPDGAPVRKTSTVAALDLRHAFGAPGHSASLAIAPQFSYDFRSDAYAIDLPVYLVTDGAGKLRGGVRFGYTNTKKTGGGRKDDASLSLFVGVPFSVFH
jgi:hypothetical protein